MEKRDFKYDTIVVGGGQAGLTTGYYLRQQKRDFVILDAGERTGDPWRERWDSLRLFTPARFNGLPGLPFPAQPHEFPTKDEMADYLENYAAHFALPVRSGVRVEHLSKHNGRFVLTAGDQRFVARNVIVAMSSYQCPRVPPFAHELDPDIVQLHSSEYRSLSQLKKGGVLVVGAGNSGAEIAVEVARSLPTWLSGKYPGHIPFRIETRAAQHILVPFVLRLLFHRVLSVFTPIGRKVRPKLLHSASPLVRTKPSDIAEAGIIPAGRTVGVQDGLPLLENGDVLDVANVVWCTGFRPEFPSWIDLPIFGKDGEPMHDRGVVGSEPGLYFVGLHFLTAVSSAQIHGIGRDAKWVVEHIAARTHSATAAVEPLQPGAVAAVCGPGKRS